MKAKGSNQHHVYSDHMVLVMSGRRLDCISSGQKTLKESTKHKEDYQAQTIQVRLFMR
jgi:hypothetical protein